MKKKVNVISKANINKYKKFEKLVRDIKNIKIQGAQDVAKAGIKAFLLNPTPEAAKKILATRPTEPFLQNAITCLLKSNNIKKTSKKYTDYIEKANKKIAKSGYKIIRNNMNIFTHCHSTTVLNLLKYAHKKGKRFVVYNTDTFPLFQGRKTAIELAKAGIKVIHLPDMASEDALKKCDLFLFGADAYLKRKIINKTGTNMLCRIAKDYHIPRYSCGVSLKYTKSIVLEQRDSKEEWNEHQKNIEVYNPAFSPLSRRFVTGVISEFGILTYKEFIKKAKLQVVKFCC